MGLKHTRLLYIDLLKNYVFCGNGGETQKPKKPTERQINYMTTYVETQVESTIADPISLQ